MATSQKIVKRDGSQPDEFEASVAQEIANLEVCDALGLCFGDCLLSLACFCAETGDLH
jgi:hypothetical protein